MTIEFTTEEMDELFSLVADEVLQDRLLKGLSITSDNQNEIMEEVYAIIFKIFDGIRNALTLEKILKEII